MRTQNLGKRESGTVDGTTPLRVLESEGGATASRRAVQIANCDAGRTLYLRFTRAGASAPTISTTNFDYALAPRATVTLAIGDGIDVWLLNDSGSVATSAFAAMEVLA